MSVHLWLQTHPVPAHPMLAHDMHWRICEEHSTCPAGAAAVPTSPRAVLCTFCSQFCWPLPWHMFSHFHSYLLVGYSLVFSFTARKLWRRKSKQSINSSLRANVAIWLCSLGLICITAGFLCCAHCPMCPTLGGDIDYSVPWAPQAPSNQGAGVYAIPLAWNAFPAILAISYLLFLL